MEENDNWQEQQGTDEQKDEEEWTDITHILIRGAHRTVQSHLTLQARHPPTQRRLTDWLTDMPM
jgi:hypothetical protein